MKKTVFIVLSLVFVIIAVGLTVYSYNHDEIFSNEIGLPKGDSDFGRREETLIDQFVDLLNGCKTEQERVIILKKAHQMGVGANEFKNVTLSESDLSIFNGKADVSISSRNGRRILTPNHTIGTAKATTKAVVAGVSMPGYALWPTIYKQQTSTYCSAATVYTVAKYIGATPPSQSAIMNFWKSQWGVTYPDLPLVRNYMNLHLPGKPSTYVQYVNKTYAGNQTTFNKDLKNNVLNYQPMILLMRNTSGTTNWPYVTNGHFCICNGLLTWENNKYFIGDPYYFSSYVPGATANNGEHKKTWNQLNAVITSRFSSGTQNYLT